MLSTLLQVDEKLSMKRYTCGKWGKKLHQQGEKESKREKHELEANKQL